MKKVFNLLLALSCPLLLAAQGSLRGHIYDAYTTTPLQNASISVNGTVVTQTDKDGSFSIDCDGATELVITAVSYESSKVTVRDCDQAFNINLTPTYYNLNEVTVNTSKPDNNLNINQAQAIAVLTRKDLTRNDGIFLENTLNLVSGVRMEKRTVEGGQRIVIRGYGNGTNFNGTGYKAYLNGIPITDATGTTILDDIDFSILGKVEVVKGPTSSLYGTGIGGVLKMYTLRPESRGTKITQEVLAGSYGLLRTNTRVETSSDNTSFMINYGHQNFDGYRIHSGSKKDFVSFVGDFRNGSKETFSVYVGYNNSTDQLAGQLDSASFYQRENKGEAPYLANNGYVSYETYRTGFANNYKFSNHVSNTSSIFFSGYKQGQAYAVGLQSNMAQNYGARTEFGFNYPGAKVSVNGTIGAEYLKNNGMNKTYGLTNNVRGPMTADLQYATQQYNIFTQWDIVLPMHFILTAGLSENFIEYGISDMLSPKLKNQSGYKSYDPVLTPRIALSKSLNENMSVYATVSQGYSPPTSSQSIVPQDTAHPVNSALKPEKGTLLEIGTKGNLMDKHLSYQLALYQLNISDKITTQTVTDPNTGTALYSYAVNVGTQKNTGIELDVAYTIQNSNTHTFTLIRPFITYSYSNFTYGDFKSDNNNDTKTKDYGGNKAVGISPHLLNVGFDLATKWGIYLNTTYQYIDKMPLTFDNAHIAKSYSLLQAKLGYRQTLGQHINFDVFAGGQNLTNSTYYNMAFLNQNYALPAAPAVFLPGPYTAMFYGGLNISYKF